jgi:hypothetical protein
MMTSKLQNLSEERFNALRDKRAALANWLGLVAAVSVGLALFFGSPGVQTLARPAALVLCVVFTGVYWFWLTPIACEDLRRKTAALATEKPVDD